MIDTRFVTAEDLETRLLNGERWIELQRGRLVRLEQPSEDHRVIVHNLSLAIAAHLRSTRRHFACFELGLWLAKGPDTVQRPAITIYPVAIGCEQADKLISDVAPELAIEIASTNDRREGIAERVKAYLSWGIRGVWVVDPVTKHVHQFVGTQVGRMIKPKETLSGDPILEGFSVEVDQLFRDEGFGT